jgi:hypothetical protein
VITKIQDVFRRVSVGLGFERIRRYAVLHEHIQALGSLVITQDPTQIAAKLTEETHCVQVQLKRSDAEQTQNIIIL